MLRQSALLGLTWVAATLAQDANLAPPVPEDAQIGALHFPITCLILGSLNQTFDVDFTGTAPAYGGSGQEVYFSDTAGVIQIPDALLQYARNLNATYASSNFSVNINVTNATPQTLMAFSAVENITFPATGGTSLRFPPGNGTLAPAGPFTLGEPNVVSRIQLGNTYVSMVLYNATGHAVSGPIDVVCGKQNIEYILGSVSVDNSTGDPPASPSNGYVPSFPPVPLNYEYGYFRFPYPCDFGGLGQQDLDLTIGGGLATFFNPGQEFFLTESNAFLRIPASAISAVKSAYSNATTLDSNITAFQVLFSSASPGVLNAATGNNLSAAADICDVTGDLVIPIPMYNNLTLGPVTAGANGDIVSIAVGNSTADVVLKDENGYVLANIPVTCTPVAYLELIGIAITDQKPDNYSLGTNENAKRSLVTRFAELSEHSS